MQGFDKVRITAVDNRLLSEHPEIIEMLQTAYNNELLAWLAYEHLKHMFFGHWRSELQSHFSSHADEEEAHAEWIGEKLAALGEPPVLDMKVLGRVAEFKGQDYAAILDFTMQLEGEAVSLYNRMLEILEDNAAMRTQIENYATIEQDHFEDFEKFMRIVPEIEEDEDEGEPKIEVEGEEEEEPEAEEPPVETVTPDKKVAKKKKGKK